MIEEAIEAAVARHVAPLEARIAELVRLVGDRLPEAPWLTRRQAAEQLGVAVDTIDRRIRAGDSSLETRRVGRSVRVRIARSVQPEEVERLAREARR